MILNFDFGLDAEKSRCKVLDAFIPANDKPDQWSSDGGNVTFYPFLVILEGTEKPGRSIWLPYWHTVEGKRKYGQWAPHMDDFVFIDLINQAREKGYLG